MMTETFYSHFFFLLSLQDPDLEKRKWQFTKKKKKKQIKQNPVWIFTLAAHPSSGQPHFNCSTATRG